MLTDPKSGDYLAWFYCTRENHRGQIAQFLRRGIFDEPTIPCSKPLSPQTTAPIEGKIDGAVEGDGLDGVDVAGLIQQARLQIDRHPAWLREAGPVARENSRPDQATFQLQTFIGGLAHHFNNLFMIIQGNLSLLQMAESVGRRHRRRFKRMERLIQCESMLTNDLLGPTVDPRYRCNIALQTRILGGVILIAEHIRPTGKNLCVFPVPMDTDFMKAFLPRLAGQVAAILDRLMNELYHHCRVIMADLPARSKDLRRLQTMTAELERGILWSTKLGEYSGDGLWGDKATGKSQLLEIAFETWIRRDRRMPLNLSCHGPVPAVNAGANALSRILAELFANAETHSPDGAGISVEIHSESNGAQITICDKGVGIDENIRGFVRLPFFSTGTTTGGCGLGLSSVEGILRSLGGTLAVESRSGEGTAVTCWLPAADGVASNALVEA